MWQIQQGCGSMLARDCNEWTSTYVSIIKDGELASGRINRAGMAFCNAKYACIGDCGATVLTVFRGLLFYQHLWRCAGLLCRV
jgi:hypothetical protein